MLLIAVRQTQGDHFLHKIHGSQRPHSPKDTQHCYAPNHNGLLSTVFAKTPQVVKC
ncbi:hypothetical protein [Thalassotalea sp. G20_0]|uniref:hypothetical protein n=1 Tax=Thalassotalea sp. G20_0 TaxID=2821093 RepID=UPI00256FC5F0|nr:hypothetical protein [Thalassotalea sp. G20_0]